MLIPTPPIADYLAYSPLRLSGNAVVVGIATPNVADRSKLRYYCDLFTPTDWLSPAWRKVITLEATARPDRTVGTQTLLGGAEIRLETILQSLHRRTSYTPAPTQAQASVCPGAIIPYRTETWVENDGAPVGNRTQQRVQYSLNGGLSFADFADNGNGALLGWFRTVNPALTWQPTTRLVDEAQPLYLYLASIYGPSATAFQTYVRVTYQDGGVDLVGGPVIEPTLPNQVYCIPVGYRALRLDTRLKPIRQWDVWISNGQNDRITQVYSYVLDTRAHRDVSYWLFLNSLGGYDTLRCIGQQTEGLNVRRSFGKRYRPAFYLPGFADLVSADVEATPTRTAHTGWMSQDELRWLNDLFVSREVYQITEKGLLAANLDNAEALTRLSTQDLRGVALEFALASTEAYHSNLPTFVGVRNRLTAWRFKPDATRCLLQGETPGVGPVWRDTGNVRCKFTAPRTSSMTEKEQADINPATNSGTRWVDAGEDAQLCPPTSTLTATIRILQRLFGNNNASGTVVSTELGVLPLGATYTHPATGSISVSGSTAQTRVIVTLNGALLSETVGTAPFSFPVQANGNYIIDFSILNNAQPAPGGGGGGGGGRPVGPR